MKKRLLAAVAAPTAILSLVPESDESPSGLSVLSSLPSGLAGALQAAILPKPRVASLQASVAMSEGAVNVSLCGVCHVEPLSSDAVRDLITRCVNDPTERVMAVAVECDPQTLSLIRIAHGAIKALPMDRVQREGSRLVREALFASRDVQNLARHEGVSLKTPTNAVLPRAIASHLEKDGVLWSDEMRVAADAAEAAGTRVICMGQSAAERLATTERPPQRSPSILSMAAGWLTAYSLCPGLDERSCDAAGVEAMNTAMRQALPARYRQLVTIPDERMAETLRTLCNELARSGGTATGGPQRIIVVVGAQHVPGLRKLLARNEST